MWFQFLQNTSFSGLPETDAGSTKDEIGHDLPITAPNTNDASDNKGTNTGGTITVALANAGHTLGGAESELVLNPLRLAFETKNAKVVELALDCLHVGVFDLFTFEFQNFFLG